VDWIKRLPNGVGAEAWCGPSMRNADPSQVETAGATIRRVAPATDQGICRSAKGPWTQCLRSSAAYRFWPDARCVKSFGLREAQLQDLLVARHVHTNLLVPARDGPSSAMRHG
jgi:hypothetical protein